MATYLQADRPMTVKTPLGEDDLLLVGLSGQETISQLFNFQLELLAENKTDIAFEKLLGQKITVTMRLPGDKMRFFSGICSRLSECERNTVFTVYRMEVVPRFWLLTRKYRSRIFQHSTVPDILKKVLEGLDVAYEIQGTFQPRDYCVQYRETDFHFASRLMEEEGIYYFFKHTADGHKMVVANTPQSHADLPDYKDLTIEEIGGGKRDEDLVFSWEKTQELRSGKVLLWDHSFELPHKHLEADKNILDSVNVGTVAHKLKVGGNDALEYFEYPGEYAQRFDGIDKSGGEQAGEMQKIFEDNKRTAGLRMQQEEVNSLNISASSRCRALTPGFKFNLKAHFNADGQYLLTSVQHSARLGGYRSDMSEWEYHNNFQCIPVALPFLPTRITPKPVIHGTQTAVVVGPSGEEIFTDKYGRVKVQFHWDRDGKYDADSSCWVRVASNWAGRNWGAISIPRIGHEVVVAFQEGDPDQPLIVGSVYNADMMPPYKLPGEKTKSTVKSDSSVGHGGFNEIRFEDKKGKEQVFAHAQKDLHIRVKEQRRELVGKSRHLIVGGDNMQSVGGDQHQKIGGELVQGVGSHHSLQVGGDQYIVAEGNSVLGAKGDIAVRGEKALLYGKSYSEVYAPTVRIDGNEITLEAGGSFIKIDASGVTIVGSSIKLNSGGAPGSSQSLTYSVGIDPKAAAEPDTAEAGSGEFYQASGAAQQGATATEEEEEKEPRYNKEENKNKESWIEIELVDEDGKPCAGEEYKIKLPDGSIATGHLNSEGRAYLKCDPGTCDITFPHLDREAWKAKQL